MDVLKAAVRVVRHVDAEVFFIFRVPQRGDLVDRDIAVYERLLQLVADEDVQAVCQLVGLGADKAGAGDVDGFVQLALAHVGQVAAYLKQLRIYKVDERLAAAYEVFVEAGDRLVHGVGHGVRGVVGVELLRLVLHEQRVAALVQRGENV